MARPRRPARQPRARAPEQMKAETMQTTALDPVTVEVVRHKLDGIANEMELTLLKSSCSPIVKEGLDASASLFTLQGETLAQAVAIPIHLATLIPCIARILAEFPIETMREGDLYCLNDPYIGGTHLPDIAVIMPVFARGRPLAFAAAMTHHQDIGGMAPGSVPTDATEIFQEGIRLPALKLRDGDRFNDTLLKILRRNVRIPDTFEGDLMAQVAACSVGARRLSALAETYGDNHLTAIFAELLDRSEAMTRDALRAIPKGTYSAVDFLDNDGIELDRRIRIEVAVTVDDGAMTIDFAGSSPQVRGPFNVVPSGSLAAACYVVRRSPTRPFRPTAAVSGRSRLICRRARSSIRRSPRRSIPARPPSSASPARYWRRLPKPFPIACLPTAAGSCSCLPSAACGTTALTT